MTDDTHDYRNPRPTKTRWSVFEPLGHEDGHEDEHGDVRGDGHDDGEGSGADATEATAALDPLLVAVAGELRRPVRLDAALDDRIMALVASEPRPRREILVGPAASAAGGARGAGALASAAAASRAWRWLRRPRLVRITPLGGLSAVAGLAALLLVTLRLDVTVGANGPIGEASRVVPVTVADAPVMAAPAAGADSVQVIQFVLVAPGAQTVALVGDFNDWQAGATPLRATAAGRVWSVEVPLAAGRHRYAFVVDDDSWVPDPSAPRAAGDDFGTPSSVVTVAESRS